MGRANSVWPLAGGGGIYLVSLRRVCMWVDEQGPTDGKLREWMSEALQMSEKNADSAVRFLLKAGLIESKGGRLCLDVAMRDWLDGRERETPLLRIHGNFRYVGEMLAETTRLTSPEKLRESAAKYGLRWETTAQVNHRLGWLKSGGFIESTDDGLLITAAGRALLGRMALEAPGVGATSVAFDAKPDIALEALAEPSTTTDGARTSKDESADGQGLAVELRDAATDSKRHDRFERAVQAAFDFLGFETELLAKSGTTDILLKASLGPDSYSVAVDAKTTGTGSLKNHQIDWEALTDHRRKHGADYSLLVGPRPADGNTFSTRATRHQVAVLSAEQLADLYVQHSRSPLGLWEYRSLFAHGAAVDVRDLQRQADDIERLRGLAAELCSVLDKECPRFGRMNAGQLQVLLKVTDQGQIQMLLETLSSPLLGVIRGDPDQGYLPATSRRVRKRRIALLADAIARDVRADRQRLIDEADLIRGMSGGKTAG